MRRSAYSTQGTRPGYTRNSRRRTSVSTKARYQRPTARNQQSQIEDLAKIVAYNRRVLRNATAYTDWYLSANTTNIGGQWNATPLMEPALWAAGNRQDADVFVSQNVYIRNMIFEALINSDQKNQAVTVDLYLLSVRPSAANWVPGVGPTGALTPGVEYESMGQGNAVSINSGVFKVLFNKQVRLFPRDNPEGGASGDLDFSGNAFSTYRKIKADIKLDFKIRSPAQLSWKSLGMSALPPAHRVWLIWRGSSADSANQYGMNWGTHITAMSQS